MVIAISAIILPFRDDSFFAIRSEQSGGKYGPFYWRDNGNLYNFPARKGRREGKRYACGKSWKVTLAARANG